MAERRSAAVALDMDSKVHQFITAGMPAAPEMKQNESNSEASRKSSVTVTSDEATPIPKPALPAPEPRPKKLRSPETESPAYARTIARARIQKSVRFLPHLIAHFEDHCRKEEMDGKKPISIQDALNEALEIWLKEKRRAK